jgi:nicotinamidase-related amidase
MSVLNSENSLLLIIDIQEKLLNAVFNKKNLEKNSEILAKTANILQIPCIITEQYPKGLGTTIFEISQNVKTCTFEKLSFNALSNEEILYGIKNIGRKQIILGGIETHICVRQTAEGLLREGYNVSVIKDFCGSRSEVEHLAGLEIMKQEGCFIKTTEMVLFELLKTAKHPNFKEIQALVK